MTIAEFIILRLKQFSCRHVFGVPGTSCSDFVDALEVDEDVKFVLTVNELEAGYMADGYGRQGSLGAVCVSYGVGTLSLANAVASALTERVPYLVINGGPTAKDYNLQEELGVLFSHSTGFGRTDFEVFKHLTVDSDVLVNTYDAATIIDRLFNSAIEKSGPVYLEVPQNLWKEPISYYSDVFTVAEPERSRDIGEISLHLQTRLYEAAKPVVLLGAELIRKDQAKTAISFIEEQQLPFFTTMLAKSIVSEDHPLFRGVYDSDLAPSTITAELESADLIISLGCIFGIDHRYLVQQKYANMIDAGYGKARVGNIKFANIYLPHLLEEFCLLDRIKETAPVPHLSKTYEGRRKEWVDGLKARLPSDVTGKSPLTHDLIFKSIDKFFNSSKEPYLYGLDTCLGSFPGADVPLRNENSFLTNPIWLSIGQGTPGSIGAYFATNKRPFIVTGDGGFQMVAQTFSTMVMNKIPAIIVIIDNGSYAIEQFLIDGDFFLEPYKNPLSYTRLNPWKYENMPAIFNGGHGFRVDTPAQLDKALMKARKINDQPVVIAATVSDRDLPAENLAFLHSLS